MKLTYEQKLLIVEDYKEIGLFATAKKWQVSNDTKQIQVNSKHHLEYQATLKKTSP